MSRRVRPSIDATLLENDFNADVQEALEHVDERKPARRSRLKQPAIVQPRWFLPADDNEKPFEPEELAFIRGTPLATIVYCLQLPDLDLGYDYSSGARGQFEMKVGDAYRVLRRAVQAFRQESVDQSILKQVTELRAQRKRLDDSLFRLLDGLPKELRR